MSTWKMNVVEPSIDDLLGDEMMVSVMRSAGLNADELRAQIRAAASRLADPSHAGGDGKCGWASA